MTLGQLTGQVSETRTSLNILSMLKSIEALMVFRKLHKKNRIRKVYNSRILKNKLTFRKTEKFKRFSMVFPRFAFKRIGQSYFLAKHLSFFPLCFSPFSSFPCFRLAEFASPSPKRDDKVNSNCSKQKESSRTPEKKRSTKEKTSSGYLKSVFPEINDIIGTGKEGPAVALYTRVSTWGQVFGGKSLEFQEKELRETAEKIGASVIYLIKDEGKSGRDFGNRNLGTILQLAVAGKINRLLVSEIDRAGRDAFELLSFLFLLRRYDVTIQTPLELLDVRKLTNLIILAVKSAGAEDQVALRGFGSLRTKVGNFQKRQWILHFPPLGYKLKGNWIAKASDAKRWKAIIRGIFVLFVEFGEYSHVCRIVNKLHGGFLKKTLKRLLTPEQISRILKDPVYIGKPQQLGEVTKKNFGNIVVDDPSLAYVDPTTFEKAQATMKAISEAKVRREKPVKQVASIFGLETALQYLPHVGVICPNCGNKMNSDGPFYICPKCGSHLNEIKKTEVAALRDYALFREKGLELLSKLSKKFKWTGAADKKCKKIEHLLKKLREKEGK